MAIYPLLANPDFSYENHVMYEQYVSDVNLGIKNLGDNIVKGQALSAQIISNSIEQNTTFLAQSIGADINSLSDSVEYGLGQVSEGIESLKAEFNIAMGKVLLQFELLREDIKIGFNRIINILENMRKTEAQEHFKDALEYYKDGCRFPEKPRWFDNALKHFLLSIESYERNPLAHLHLGHIYHYQNGHRNFKQALDHYELCYTYGEANQEDYPVAAQGYFYAGWLKAAVFKNIDDAIELTKKSVELAPNISEGYYHLAKFYSVTNNIKDVLKNLQTAICDFDTKYFIKASCDPDFDNIRPQLNKFFKSLVEKKRQELKIKIKDVKQLTKDKVYLTDEAQKVKNKIEKNLHEIQKIYQNSNTYCSYVNALKICGQTELMYSSLFPNYLLCIHEEGDVQNVESISFTPDSKYLAFAKDKFSIYRQKPNYSNEIYILDVMTGEIITTMKSKNNNLRLSYSVDGKYLAVGSCREKEYCEIKGIEIYDMTTTKVLSVIPDVCNVNSIEFSPDGKFLAASISTWPDSIEIFELTLYNKVASIKECEAFTFSHDGRYIAAGSKYSDGIKIFDLSNNNNKIKLIQEDIKGSISSYSMSFSPDDKYLAIGIGDRDYGRLEIWDFHKKIKYMSINANNRIRAVTFIPNTQILVYSDFDGKLDMIDLFSKNKMKSFVESNSRPDYAEYPWVMKFSPNGKYFSIGFYGGQGLKLWCPQIIPKQQMSLIEIKRKKEEERKQKEILRQENERQKKVEELKLYRKKNQLCLKCGEPLSFFQKIKGSFYCKEHAHLKD